MKALDSVFSKATKIANSMYDSIKNINYTEPIVKTASGIVAGLVLTTAVGAGVDAVAQEKYKSNINSGKAIYASITNYESSTNKLKTIGFQDAKKYSPKEPEGDPSFIGPIEIISQYDSRFVGPIQPQGLTGEISGKLTSQLISENNPNFVGPVEPQGLIGEIGGKLNSQNIDNSDAVTSFYGDIVLDQFSPPNYTIPLTGAGSLNYYGSGDADNDGDIDFTDYSTMLSNTSDRTDVNGDGVTNTADKTMLYNYLTDQTPNLQSHWGFLSSTEKTSWLQNMLAIDLTNQHPYIPGVWECDQYTLQTVINFAGIKNIANSGINFSVYDTTKNGRFNIPIYGVSTKTSSNIAHRINSVLIGEPGNVFSQEKFIEPQTDQFVTQGSQSLNQYANISRFCHYFNTLFQQNMYGEFGILNFNINGTPTVTFQHPDLVINKPVKWTYKHIGGANPADITIDPEDSTLPSNTGQPNPAAWASTYYSDINNRTGGNYDSTYWNYDIERAWRAISDSSSLIDTTYSSHDNVNFPGRNPQTISIRDVTNPVITENTSQTSIAYSQFLANGLIKPTVTDNCGYWDSTYVVTTTQGASGTCEFYEFMATANTNAVDPTGNESNSSKNVEVYLDDSQWQFVPPTFYANYGDALDPANTGGFATATNPAGVTVDISYEDSSTQNSDPSVCEHYNFEVWRGWDATTQPCENVIEATQAIFVSETEPPIWTEFPDSPFYVNYGESIHPDHTGWPEGEDPISNMPVVKNWYDSITSSTTTQIYFDRHWSLADICSTSTGDSVQQIIQDVMPGIPESQQDKEFMIYPNPTTGQAHIKMNNSNSGIIKVTDLAGRTLEEILVNKGVEEVIYDASRLNPGMYLINLGKETEKLLKVN